MSIPSKFWLPRSKRQAALAQIDHVTRQFTCFGEAEARAVEGIARTQAQIAIQSPSYLQAGRPRLVGLLRWLGATAFCGWLTVAALYIIDDDGPDTLQVGLSFSLVVAVTLWRAAARMSTSAKLPGFISREEVEKSHRLIAATKGIGGRDVDQFKSVLLDLILASEGVLIAGFLELDSFLHVPAVGVHGGTVIAGLAGTVAAVFVTDLLSTATASALRRRSNKAEYWRLIATNPVQADQFRQAADTEQEGNWTRAGIADWLTPAVGPLAMGAACIGIVWVRAQSAANLSLGGFADVSLTGISTMSALLMLFYIAKTWSTLQSLSPAGLAGEKARQITELFGSVSAWQLWHATDRQQVIAAAQAILQRYNARARQSMPNDPRAPFARVEANPRCLDDLPDLIGLITPLPKPKASPGRPKKVRHD